MVNQSVNRGVERGVYKYESNSLLFQVLKIAPAMWSNYKGRGLYIGQHSYYLTSPMQLASIRGKTITIIYVVWFETEKQQFD